MREKHEQIKELLGPLLVWQIGTPGPVPPPVVTGSGSGVELALLLQILKRIQRKKSRKPAILYLLNLLKTLDLLPLLSQLG